MCVPHGLVINKMFYCICIALSVVNKNIDWLIGISIDYVIHFYQINVRLAYVLATAFNILNAHQNEGPWSTERSNMSGTV